MWKINTTLHTFLPLHQTKDDKNSKSLQETDLPFALELSTKNSIPAAPMAHSSMFRSSSGFNRPYSTVTERICRNPDVWICLLYHRRWSLFL